MTPAERQAELLAVENTLTGNPADVGRLNRLREIDVRATESENTDTLAHIRDRGIAAVAPVDIGDRTSVQGRIAVAEAAFRQYTPDATAIQYFDQGEVTELGSVLSGNDPDAALGVIANVMNNFGDRAPAALAQLGEKDPIALMAGSLVLETGETATARTMLMGRKFKAEGSAAVVSPITRRAVAAEMAPLFGTGPDANARLTTLLDAADLHYAAAGVGIADPKSAEARTVYLAGLDAALGRQNAGQGMTVGGRQSVNGTETILPARMSAALVEIAIQTFDISHFQRASLTGNAPLWGNNRSSPEFTSYGRDDRAKVAIVSLGQGIYTLTYNDKTLFDPGQRDGVFRFDLMSLATGKAAP
jgi:hypothetical protein